MAGFLGSDAKKRNVMNIVDRPLPDRKSKKEVSLSAFCFLFSELVQYTHRRVTHIKDLERRLADVGYSVGLRLLEYIAWKEKFTKRDTRMVRFLQFIANTVWKMLFGKPATLEKSMDKKEQFMITEDTTLINKFISVPKDMQGLNCASLVGGIVEGMLDGAEFPARVSTHSVQTEERFPKTVILIEFEDSVLERDKKLG
eukprot:TRINITY_DN5281_c0_g1_i1.p1 TRINITY_DN5281_c0_g1~~TRINITY_DN5281_c0_g1_i1.p1  ORF type:complete len:199 (-),score=30.03 TRINITY_DN5281_c0_g1_i1:114-710(-)